jgi:catechol 2,3-dioxygenase-like lactoylglutathione lyase family enzyme
MRNPARMRIDLVALIVDEYDAAVALVNDVLGFDLVEDSPSLTNDGRLKRWVVVRPPGTSSELLRPIQRTGLRASETIR